MRDVGTRWHVGGEISLQSGKENRAVDITELVKRHGDEQMTFLLVRELREAGDDRDKDISGIISRARILLVE